MTDAGKYPRWLFVVTGVGFALVLLALIGILALWLFLPTERIRETFTRELSRRLNQDVSIRKVTLGFYPDVELVAKGVRIVDRKTSEQVVSVQAIRFDVNLVQLLRRQIELEDIVITSPEIRLSRLHDGKWNVEQTIAGIRGGRKPKQPDDKGSAVRGFELSPISVKNGTIRIYDQASDRRLNIENIRLTFDHRNNLLTLHSAHVSYAPLEAEFSGTISDFNSSGVSLDVDARARILKKGPLKTFSAPAIPVGAQLARISITATGRSDVLNIRSAFAADSRLAGGLNTNGTLAGTLTTKEGSLDISELSVSLGLSHLSVSGTCSSLWNEQRSATLKGVSKISLSEIARLIDNSSVSEIGPQGTANASLSLDSTVERTALDTNIDLADAGFTIPQVTRKEPRTPGSLRASALFKPHGELSVDSFECVIGDAVFNGTANVNPEAVPWIKATVNTSNLPLKSLSEIPHAHFEEGDAAANVNFWKTDRDDERLEVSGTGNVSQAVLKVDSLNQPLRDLDARIAWTNDRAEIGFLSCQLGQSMFQTQADIIDFKNPRIIGTVQADVLNLNELVGTITDESDDSDEIIDSESSPTQELTLELLVNADTVYAGDVRIGPVSTTWRLSDRIHHFDPIDVVLFDGTAAGSLEVDTSKEKAEWKSTFEGQNMDLEKLYAQLNSGNVKMKGKLNASADIRGLAAGGKEDVLRSLQGDVKIEAQDGEVRQSPLLKSIFLLMQIPIGPALLPGVREISIVNTIIDAAQTRGRSLNPSVSPFNKIDGTFRIVDGIAKTKDFRFESGTVDLLFKGKVDLAKNEMDMKIRATPLGVMGSVIGKIPLAGDQLKKAKEKVLSTDFIAEGPLSNPDVKVAMIEKIREQTEKIISNPDQPESTDP